MNFQILSDIVKELSSLLAGARLERIVEDRSAMYFILMRNRKRFFLLLSPDRSLPRVHLVSKKPGAAASSHGFSLYLKSHLTGARVTRIGLLNQDRVVEFCFSRHEKEYRIFFELTGSSSNMIITDGSLIILALYYPVPIRDSGRILGPGLHYMAPIKKEKQYQGPISGLSGISVPAGHFDSAYVNREAEAYYERLLEQKQVESQRTKIRSLIKKAITRIKRRIEALTDDLDKADKAEDYKETGTLILENLDRLKQGMQEADLAGYDGRIRRVGLDPKYSPVRNAEVYFKKYKKAKSGRTIISSRLDDARSRLLLLESALLDLEKIDSRNELSHLGSRLVAIGYAIGNIEKKRSSRPEPDHALFRTIVYLGWEILIGKSAAGNDYLTTKIARDRDLWLHSEGLPGSHVLIKNPEGREIPPEVLQKAASFAAFYSKGKNAGKVPVAYTLARYVKKPKGAKAGLVTLSERKTIMARPEEDDSRM